MSLLPTSLHHLAEALSESDDIVIFVDRKANGRLTIFDCNDVAIRTLGYERSAILGRFALQDLAEKQQAEALAKLEDATLARRSFNGDLRLRNAEGRDFWFGYHAMPCPSTRHVSLILGRDITARRAEREQASVMQAMLAKVFTMVEAGISIVGPDGTFLMTNPFHDRMLGYAPGSLNGKQSRDSIAPQSQNTIRQIQQSAFQNQNHLAHDMWLLRADGSSVEVRMSSSLLEGPDRKLRVVTVVPVPSPTVPSPTVPSPTVPSPTVPSPAAPPPRQQTAGKIRLISLEEIRDSLGDRWAALEAKVMERAEHIIRSRIDADDSFRRTADRGFVVCFPYLSEEEAALKAEMIAREIRLKLIGQPEFEGGVEIAAVVATLPVAHGADPLNAVENGLTEIERRCANIGFEAKPRIRPILFAKSGNRMGSYLQLADRLPGGGRLVLPPSQLDRALHLLRLAANQVTHDQADRSENRPVMFPLDFDLFLTRAKTEPLINACQTLNAATRHNLVPLLCGLPPGLSSSKFLDVVQRLRPFCSAIGFRIDGKDAAIPDLSGAPNPILVVDAATWDRSGDVPDRFLTRLVGAATPYRGRTLALNIPSGETLHALAICGVELFTSGE